ncbi:MAG: tRNA epoxyqueuosine(34) reductase QueG [Myxococcales bacterium]|nr:tRNA epoxyqueuosine(34) reductase QueG [Myxococcales bacterium]
MTTPPPNAAGPLRPLDVDRLERLRAAAAELGLLHLGAVDLDHPGFSASRDALRRFLAEGKAGSMEFLERGAAARLDPRLLLEGARTVLIACVPYDGEAGPVARYAQSLDYHTVIHSRLLALAERLRELVPGASALVCVDTKPLLERAAAALAGLGFIGKHGCLIVPGLGSYVLLGSLLTDAPLDEGLRGAAKAIAGAPWDACGACRRCLDACPTQAFDGPGDLDPRRCISYLTIEERGPIPEALAAKIGERIAGCDACQEVCPYNAGADRRLRAPASAWIDLPPRGRRAIDLVAIADIGSSQQRALARKTALRRIPRRHLRRNAIIALANRRGPATPAEAGALIRAAADPDPEIAAVGRWACARRGVAGPEGEGAT